MIGPSTNRDLYEVRYAIMVDLIRMAYGVDKDKVVNGPIWISMYRYDVKAKAPAGSTPEAKNRMLQSLLADRFHLVAHSGTKPVDGYLLSAGKRLRLKQATGTEEWSGCRTGFPRPPEGAAADASPSQMITVTCRNITMQGLIDVVRNLPRSTRAQANPPIIDHTGLNGAWNFEFEYDVRTTRGENDAAFAEVFDQQLGLKLEPGTVPMPVVDVQSMDFDPTPNPPGLEKVFPPPPSEFEVAALKPCAPESQTRTAFEIRNGRVTLSGIPLGFLIRIAWDLDDTEIVGAPKWLDSARFDLNAKMADGWQTGSFSPMEIENVRPALRNLLMQKFNLKVHTEDRPTDAYVLKSVKPKLTPTSDVKRRAGWHDGPPYATTDRNLLNPALGRIITCTNLSMAEFARLLPGMDPSAFRHPVRDATGIEGTFDFTINFERYAILSGGRGGMLVFTPSGVGTIGGGGEPNSEPNDKLSIYDAVRKQLGLKLELEKRPYPVLVIDSVEQNVVEN